MAKKTRTKKTKKVEEYTLVPFNEITDEARRIAVLWVENFRPMGFDIEQKHKLASDIMNYAKTETENKIRELYEHIKHGDAEHQLWLKNKIEQFLL